jgi:N-acetylmuramoyl-L-alanine amidase
MDKSTIEPNVVAAIKDGRRLSLEIKPPRGPAGKALLEKYLADDNDWKVYEGKGLVAIPFEKLDAAGRRSALLAVYPEDVVDERGWLHTVIHENEALWTLCEWITGKSNDYHRVMNDNGLAAPPLSPGMAVLIAPDLLPEVMRKHTPPRMRMLEPEPEILDLVAVGAQLTYGEDRDGKFAAYRLKKGEALYTSVVVQFTDFQEYAAVMEGVEIVRKRNKIADVTDISVGTEIRIPFDILSARYLPQGTQEREAFEETIRVAKELKRDRVRTRDLEGVVVVLDPGHGIFDIGAENRALGLFEDEINYDIACRIKRILDTSTEARAYMTLEDVSQGFMPSDARRFVHDTDERILTSPAYAPNKSRYDNKVSLNLRWMLANAIQHAEIKAGSDPRKIVFSSIHTDALYSSIRGAMVYIPGASHRSTRERPEHVDYASCQEGRDFGVFTCTNAELRLDEASSLNFAQVLMDELGKKRIKRHSKSDPIRNVIRRDRGPGFVPAVLRNSSAPVKVLVETANINNRTDCERLADPEWRQLFAEAYVDALKQYFGS